MPRRSLDLRAELSENRTILYYSSERKNNSNDDNVPFIVLGRVPHHLDRRNQLHLLLFENRAFVETPPMPLGVTKTKYQISLPPKSSGDYLNAIVFFLRRLSGDLTICRATKGFFSLVGNRKISKVDELPWATFNPALLRCHRDYKERKKGKKNQHLGTQSNSVVVANQKKDLRDIGVTIFFEHRPDVVGESTGDLEGVDAVDVGVDALPLGDPGLLVLAHGDDALKDLRGARVDSFRAVLEAEEGAVGASVELETL